MVKCREYCEYDHINFRELSMEKYRNQIRCKNHRYTDRRLVRKATPCISKTRTHCTYTHCARQRLLLSAYRYASSYYTTCPRQIELFVKSDFARHVRLWTQIIIILIRYP